MKRRKPRLNTTSLLPKEGQAILNCQISIDCQFSIHIIFPPTYLHRQCFLSFTHTLTLSR